ncbi:hypothetical protein ACFWMH_10345 [Streptomyces tendae]|uniref:hypothetical protein n=1 Tax=Streptomyces tendae TaxID=1932 RepID=UPI00365BA50A
MAKTLTPAEITAAAEAEAEAAEQRAAELRAAVENGDTTVTPAALAEAEQVGVFARLRIKAAEKRAAAQAEADRHKRAEAVADEAAALAEQDDTEDLAVKMRTAVDALAALYATAADRHDRIKEMAGRVDVIRREAEQAGIPDTRARYGIGRGGYAGELALAVGKTTPTQVRAVSPADAVATAVALALPAGDPYAAGPVSEACTHAPARAKKVCERVPAIGAQFTAP